MTAEGETTKSGQCQNTWWGGGGGTKKNTWSWRPPKVVEDRGRDKKVTGKTLSKRRRIG